MSLIFSVKPNEKIWKEGEQYHIDLTVYSTTEPWNKTDLVVSCPEAMIFTGYTIKSPTLTPISIKNNGVSADTTGRGQQLNFVASFGGGPSAASKLEVSIFAMGKSGVRDTQTVVSTATVSLFDSSKRPESKTQKEKISLAGLDGVFVAPDIPQKLKAVPVGPVAVQLTWSKQNQAREITIQRDTDSAFATPDEWSIGGDPGTYLDLNNDESPILLPETVYYYRIKASNSLLTAGTAYSTSDSALTPSNPPTPSSPTALKASKQNKTQVKVSWKGIPKLKIQTDEGKATLTPIYQVQYGTDTGGPYALSFGSYSPDDNCTVDNLAPNTTYYFVVKASYLEAPSIVSVNSAQVSAKTDDVPGTANPLTGVTATPTINKITLAWTDTNNGNASVIISRATSTSGPFLQVVETSPGAISYEDTNRSPSTAYFYQLTARNSVGPSTPVSTTATTLTPPDPPVEPVNIVATTINDSQISLDYQDSGNGTLTFRIFRGTAPGGPYTKIAEVPVDTVHYVDTNLTPGATFYYVVRAWNEGGDSADSVEVFATTYQKSSTILTQSGFSFDPQARCMVKQIGGRAVYTSDRDRPVVWIGGNWYPEGLKPHLLAPTATATTGGALEPDDYKIYSKLIRNLGKTRSEFSPVEEITISGSNNRLRITPQLTGDSPDTVECRDTGFDITGTSIPAADFVEIYIAASGTPTAVLLTTILLNDGIWETPGYYQAPADLDQASLFNNNRRPMEKLGECSLPPACSVIVPFGPRMYAFGETNIGPSAAQMISATASSLSISGGARTFTVSNYTLTDAIIYHEVWINGKPTGWFVYDVEGTTGYIRNADPTKDIAGYEGSGGGFPNFFFGGTPSRMYSSAFFSGEAGGLPTYSPETYPPLCTFDRELSPDDNTDAVAAIVLGDSLLIGKPARWILIRGGNNLGFPNLEFETLATGSGINSPRTLVKDSQDRAYFLGDTGPFRVTPAGVEKINVFTGNQRLFEQVFDISSVPDSIGTWFSREDWYVCTSLDLIGNSGHRDGFVLDLKNNVLMPFSVPMRITWAEEVKNIKGTFQIDFGEDLGRSGVLFKDGLSTDAIDFSLPNPSGFAIPIQAHIKSAILNTENRVGIRSFQPSIRVTNGTVDCSFSVIRKDRMDDPNSEQIVENVDFDTDDKRNRFDMVNHSFPNALVRMDFTMPVSPPGTTLEMRDVAMEVVTRGPIQRV